MNEPLNHPGRTSWPAWHSQPLRLTAAEIENPRQVFEEFFQCYHLPDIRTCLNNWLQDALGKESVDNKQHYETHQQVEKLVEAAWLVNRKSRNIEAIEPTTTDDLDTETDPNEVDTVFEVYQKEPQLIELSRIDPLKAINEVFSRENLVVLKENVTKWLHVVLATDWRDYANADHRVQLLEFYEELLLFIEAVYVIFKRATENEQSGSELPSTKIPHEQPALLNEEQLSNPAPVILHLFKRFPQLYIQRELWEWLSAGLTFSGEFSERLYGLYVLSTYEEVLCLIESAHQLIRLGIITTNTATIA